MIKEFIHFSKEIGWRRKVNVFLPSTYDNKKKFPVIYAFDGANLYNPKNSLSGYSWEVDKAIETLIKEKKTEGFIVVGIYTSKNRLLEYSPVPYLKETHIKGEPIGDKTISFFDEVRKIIDKEYLTNGINHIMGSSCGGIMSLYSIIKEKDVYETAGVFSIASMILVDDYHKMVEEAILNKNNRVFLYMGEKESLDASAIKEVEYLNSIIKNKGIKTEVLIGKNKKHDEKAWSIALYDYLKFIEKK